MKLPAKIFTWGLAAFLLGAPFAPAAVLVGQPFPKLENFLLNGSLPDRTGRVVLVDFWATWCAPCRSSFPAYSELQKEFGGRGLVVIGVSVDQDDVLYSNFVDRYEPAFTTLRDLDNRLVAAVRPPAMPTCYLIDRNGQVRVVHTGFHGKSTTRQLRQEIIKLLEEKS